VFILSSASTRNFYKLRPGLFAEGFAIADGQQFAFGLQVSHRRC
jgi:hypothetical protein